MSAPFRIFLGCDPREVEGAKLCAWTIRKHASIPVDIRFLNLQELTDVHGFQMAPRQASTDFAFSRFAIPWLCGYEGKALFLDGADMLVLGDVAELYNLPLDGLALRCTQHTWQPTATVKFAGEVQTAAPRKLWASVMLLNCDQLRIWTKEAVETWSGKQLHRFEGIPDEQIGEIDLNWNEIDRIKPDTKLYHWTERGPIFDPGNCSEELFWLRTYRQYCYDCGVQPSEQLAASLHKYAL